MAQANRARTAAPPPPVGEGGSGAPRRWTSALLSLGPFAAALVAYKGLLD